MSYMGDFNPGATVRRSWNSVNSSGASSVPTTIGTAYVYKDDSLTQSTTGVTYALTHDGVSGINRIKIDTSADTTFYSRGSYFEVWVVGTVIDTQTVNAYLFGFSLENQSITPRDLGMKDKKATAQAYGVNTLTLANGTTATAGDFIVIRSGSTGANQGAHMITAIDATAPTAKVATVDPNFSPALSGTVLYDCIEGQAATSALPEVNVIDWKNATAPAMTGDAFARLGAPAGVSVSADVAAVAAKTTNLPGSPAAVGSAMTLSSGERTTTAGVVWDTAQSAHLTAGTFGKFLDAAVSSVSTSGLTATDIANAVWGTTVSGTVTALKAMRGFVATQLGKVSGMDLLHPKFRNPADSKNVVDAVIDKKGNRTTVTLDLDP